MFRNSSHHVVGCSAKVNFNQMAAGVIEDQHLCPLVAIPNGFRLHGDLSEVAGGNSLRARESGAGGWMIAGHSAARRLIP
jgi:hypothetical protein